MPHARCKGFSLAEVVAALLILGFFSSGMMLVINRCTAWAANSAIKMQAFEVARENMEQLLSLDSAEEVSEGGNSEKYPEIRWQTDVETFYEPVTSRMWVRAVCSTQYDDADGEEQTIKLEHWLTNISKEQLLEIMQRDKKDKEGLAGQVFGTIEEAASYAGVDVETIEEWIDKGLVPLDDGTIPKQNLDIFVDSSGNPPADQIQAQIETQEELQQLQPDSSTGQEPATGDDSWLDEIDPTTGMTHREIEEDPEKFWQKIMEVLSKR
jgi:prepilin-type N-terminal cleavage/methylation domain-containing protein